MGSIVSIISIISKVASIFSTHLKILDWLKSKQKSSNAPLEIFLKEGNIYGRYKDGKEKQLTYQSADFNPILLKRKFKIVFFRSEVVRGTKEFTRYKLLVLDTRTLEERLLLDQKPTRDGLDNTFDILHPVQLKANGNQTNVFFITDKYATGSVLAQMELATGKYKELFPAENFELIASGKHKGKLLIAVSLVGENGRCIFYKMMDTKGKVVRNFSNYDEYMQFRSKILVEA